MNTSLPARLAALLLAVSALATRAATFEVTSLADDGPGTLRAAITNANATAGAHTISFPGLMGTIQLDTALPKLMKPMQFLSASPHQVAIRRNGAGTFGAFEATDYSTMTNLAVTGLAFRNFNRPEGAIYCRYNSLAVTNCVFEGNTSAGVSAVYANELQQLALVGCTFSGNSSASTTVQIQGPKGFAISDCSFLTNSTSGNGGAMRVGPAYYYYVYGSVRRCTFAGNHASGGGGAVHCDSNWAYGMEIADSTFEGNSCGNAPGGALNNYGCTSLTLRQCTFTGNTTGAHGGAVFCGDNWGNGNTTLINCTLTANRCGTIDNAGNGGALFAQGGTQRGILRNTIVAGNADSGSLENDPDVFGGIVSQGWNFIGATNGAPQLTNSLDHAGTAAAPLNPRLSTLGQYGGTTRTHLLLPDSPARDQGNVSGLGLFDDQRGHDRVLDGPAHPNAPGGDGSDIGSTELRVGTNDAPWIALQPADTSVKAGGATLLSGGAVGTEPIAYQWRRSGVPIPGATGLDLAFTDIQPQAGGFYDLVASNAYGASTSAVATLTVLCFRVTNTNDSGPGSLRQAVTDANAYPGDDRIYFLDDAMNPVTGTISLATGLPNLTGGLLVLGPGATQMTIRRGGGGTFAAFYDTGINPKTALGFTGLTFQNFNHNDGAIYAHYDALALTNCVFEGNASTGHATLHGWESEAVALVNCSFNGNTAGGVVVNLVGPKTFTVLDCVFRTNSTASGALYLGSSPYYYVSGSIRRCSFTGNYAANGGGAIACGANWNYGFEVAESTFEGNSCGNAHGGAVANGGCPNLTLSQCTFSGNTAGVHGGAVYCGDNWGNAVTTLINCTLTANRCGTIDNAGNGGALFAQAGTQRGVIRNTILAGNADSGSFENDPEVFGGIVSQGWNLIGATNGAPQLTNSLDHAGTTAAPLNPRLAPLGDYGGPTRTHLLYDISPAVDQGNVTGLGLTNDQRGFVRVIDEALIPDASGGDGSDIGAVEGSIPEPLPRLTIVPLAGGQARISWEPDSPGFVLQETPALAGTWTNAPSGALNPVIIPTTVGTRFYRVMQP
jgi:predicted outer membrane repeat protein